MVPAIIAIAKASIWLAFCTGVSQDVTGKGEGDDSCSILSSYDMLALLVMTTARDSAEFLLHDRSFWVPCAVSSLQGKVWHK